MHSPVALSALYSTIIAVPRILLSLTVSMKKNIKQAVHHTCLILCSYVLHLALSDLHRYLIARELYN